MDEKIVKRESFNSNKKEELAKMKARKRPRTKAIRLDLKNRLETAILSSDFNVRDLFLPKDNGILQAPLVAVFFRLNLLTVPKFASLSAVSLKSISNITRIFQIVEFPSDQVEQYKNIKNMEYEERDGYLTKFENLWICVNSRVCEASDEKTVYVDNLPPQCSEAKLRRRAIVFGSVVNVFLPKISRIQHHSGSNSVLNSGFGFVQFASKTAAKRFCKRYVANSRLKRAKSHNHPHGHYNRKKNLNALKAADLSNNDKDEITLDETKNSEKDDNNGTFLTMATSFEFHRRQMLLEEESALGITNSASLNDGYEHQLNKIDEEGESIQGDKHCDSITEETWVIETANFDSSNQKEMDLEEDAMSRKRTLQDSDIPSSRAESSNAKRQKVGDLSENSTLEHNAFGTSLLSLYDSGNDTETELARLGQKTQNEKNTAETTRKRCRRRRNRTNLVYCYNRSGVGSLTNLLRRIQVFPLKQYRDLRAEYLRLKKERLTALKQQISEAKVESNRKSNNENSNKRKARRRRNKTKKHTKEKIFEMAQKIKEKNFFDP